MFQVIKSSSSRLENVYLLWLCKHNVQALLHVSGAKLFSASGLAQSRCEEVQWVSTEEGNLKIATVL